MYMYFSMKINLTRAYIYIQMLEVICTIFNLVYYGCLVLTIYI